MAKKIKMSRKQIKQPDEFISFGERAYEWLEENFLTAAAAIAGIIALVLIIQFSVKSIKARSDKPAEEFAAAMEIINARVIEEDPGYFPGSVNSYRSEKDKHDALVETLGTFVDSEKNSTEGQMGLFYLASSYEKVEEYDKAIDYYKRFSDSKLANTADPGFKNAAIDGMARCLYRKGDLDGALAKYNELIGSDSGFQADAYLNKARILFKKGDTEAAQKTLDEMGKSLPDSWMSNPREYLVSYWEKQKASGAEEDGSSDDIPAGSESLESSGDSVGPLDGSTE